jgi:uncharacterized protein (TIGR00661 family)
MKILYGVVGEGMGHAMRSRVVLDHLTQQHDVQVVVSGRRRTRRCSTCCAPAAASAASTACGAT